MSGLASSFRIKVARGLPPVNGLSAGTFASKYSTSPDDLGWLPVCSNVPVVEDSPGKLALGVIIAVILMHDREDADPTFSPVVTVYNSIDCGRCVENANSEQVASGLDACPSLYTHPDVFKLNVPYSRKLLLKLRFRFRFVEKHEYGSEGVGISGL